ncbi:MAG: response regulator, partial [Prosthecobacter sp.]|nr:response regulator [Prosthecobacter sp.]
MLHLEDSIRDAELIAARLEFGGLVAEIDQVDNWDAFNSALVQQPYDIILCDYNLPGYDGLAALKLAREKQPHTPVIVISGSIGEDEAVKCLHQGATDYLLKGRLERLIPAVSRALNESEQRDQQRRAEEKLRHSEERFRQFAEHSNDAVWIVELNPERIAYVSPAVERIWGLSAAAFSESARVWLAAVHPE